MTKGKKKVHEEYHKKTRKQIKIIKANNFTYKHLIKFITMYLNKNDKILDIGTGAGTLALYFASKGYEVTAVDISEKAIKSCIESNKAFNFSNVKFIVDDFQNTKIKKKFDFIIFTEVIEHLPDDDMALKSIYKLLKPNGTLFLSTPSSNAPMHKLGLAKEFDQQVGHLRRYSKKEITSLIKNNNFKVLEVVENEGVIRNFFFLNEYAGKFIKFFKYYISDFVSFVDNISLKIFGESNYFIVAKKKYK